MFNITMNEFTQYLPDEVTMRRFAKHLAQIVMAQASPRAVVIYLHGDLGAGKTTFTRGMIQGLGFAGNVKSPTYTLVEEYQIANKAIYHFDLYRLASPEELEYMGIRDYFDKGAICILEWPEKGGELLPSADLELFLDYVDDARSLRAVAQTELGHQIISEL
jgi:hydrolase, P-loop family